jgi:hypothetical protein
MALGLTSTMAHPRAPFLYVARIEPVKSGKCVGWEMAARTEKIPCIVLDEAHKRQVEETMGTLSEGPEGFYGLEESEVEKRRRGRSLGKFYGLDSPALDR